MIFPINCTWPNHSIENISFFRCLSFHIFHVNLFVIISDDFIPNLYSRLDTIQSFIRKQYTYLWYLDSETESMVVCLKRPRNWFRNFNIQMYIWFFEFFFNIRQIQSVNNIKIDDFLSWLWNCSGLYIGLLKIDKAHWVFKTIN